MMDSQTPVPIPDPVTKATPLTQSPFPPPPVPGQPKLNSTIGKFGLFLNLILTAILSPFVGFVVVSLLLSAGVFGLVGLEGLVYLFIGAGVSSVFVPFIFAYMFIQRAKRAQAKIMRPAAVIFLFLFAGFGWLILTMTFAGISQYILNKPR